MLNAADLVRSCAAVVFDCAGTLLRLDPPEAVIFRDAAAELGLTPRLEDIRRAYELVHFSLHMQSSQISARAERQEFYRKFNRDLCLALGIERTFEGLHSLLMRRFAERRKWVAFADAVPALRALRQQVPVHALANWDKGLDTVLREAGLRDLIGDAAASELLGAEKPARACFEAFMARNMLTPDRLVYVGNEYLADIVGARDAGLTPVLLDRDDRMAGADCARIGGLLELVPT